MSTRKRFMRSKPSGWKQVEAVRIEAQTNGKWDVRVEGRSHPYTGVGGTWLDADNQPGEDAILGFIQGNPLLPFFFSRGSRPNSAYVANGAAPTPATLTSNWICRGGDFGRTQSWTAATLPGVDDLIEASGLINVVDTRDIPSQIQLPRFRDDLAAWVDSEIGVGHWLIVQQGATLSEIDLTTELPGSPDWASWEPESLCLGPDGEIVLGWRQSDGGSGTKSHMTLFLADYTGAFGAVFSGEIPQQIIDGGDIMIVAQCAVIPIVNYLFEVQLAVIDISPGSSFVWEYVVPTEGFTHSLEVLSDADAGEWSPTCWADDARAYFLDGSGTLHAVDVESRTVAWTYSGDCSVVPLALADGRLLCVYEERLTTTITDTYQYLSWDGGSWTEDRTELAAGHSLRSGLMYLNATSGAEIRRAMFPGTESNGGVASAIVEYRGSHTGTPWIGPTKTGPNPTDHIFSCFRPTGHAQFNDILGPAWEPPVDYEDDVRSAAFGSVLADNIKDYYASSGTSDNVEAWEKLEPLVEAWRDAELARFNAVVGMRVGSGDWLRGTATRAVLHVLSTTGVAETFTRYSGIVNTTEPTATSGLCSFTQYSRFIYPDEPEYDGLVARDYWHVLSEDLEFQTDTQAVFRASRTSALRTKTTKPAHARSPVALGPDFILFPADDVETGDMKWTAYSRSTLLEVWSVTVTVDGVATFVGPPVVVGDKCFLPHETTAPALISVGHDGGDRQEIEPPTDALRLIPDLRAGQEKLHDYYGRWALE